MNIGRITYNDDQENELDEMVVRDVEMIHIERMSDGHIWIGIYGGDERIFVNLHSETKILGYAEKDDHE